MAGQSHRLWVTLASALCASVVVGCGSSGAGTADPAEFSAEMTRLCDQASAASVDLTYSADPETFAEQARDLSSSLGAVVHGMDPLLDGAYEERVGLYSAFQALHQGVSGVGLYLRSEEPDRAVENITSGRQGLDEVDAAAAEHGLGECGSDAWGAVASFFDQAEQVVVTLREELAPTGDYDVDVAEACASFAEEVAGAPLGSDDPTQVMIAASAYRDGLGQLATDFSRLQPPPELADAHADFIAALEVASETMADVVGLASGNSDEDVTELQRRVLDALTAVFEGASALGITC